MHYLLKNKIYINKITHLSGTLFFKENTQLISLSSPNHLNSLIYLTLHL